MQCSSQTSWSRGMRACVFLLTLLMAGPIAVHGQEVPLTLNYHEAEGHVPEGTEVVVWYEQENAQTLSHWGGRAAMKDSLISRAGQSFERVYDGVDGEGQTRTIRIDGDGDTAAYVLARLPEDAEESHRFYESRREDQAGLDVVQTGNLEMIPVEGDDAAWAQDVFEAITSEELVSTTLRLTGEAAEGVADIRIWKKEGGGAFESLGARESVVEESYNTQLEATDGRTDGRFERTAYSNRIVYVLAQKTDAEGKQVLYESMGDDGLAGFGPVTGDGTISMEPVPEEHEAIMAELFPETGGGEWLTWTFFGLVGGLLLNVLLIAGRLLTKKKQRKNRRREKGKMERFWKAVIPSSRDTTEPAVETPAQISEEGKGRESSGLHSQEIVASNQQKDAQKTEIIDDLRYMVKELKEKVRKRNETIQEFRDQVEELKENVQQRDAKIQEFRSERKAEKETSEEAIEALKEKLQSKDQKLQRKAQAIQDLKERCKTAAARKLALNRQIEDLHVENERLSEEVDQLSATVTEKEEAFQAAKSEEIRAYSDEETAKHIEKLEDENEWLEQTMKALRRRLPDAPVENEDEEHETALAQQVAELRTKNEQLEATVSDLESKLTETTDALEAAQAEDEATDSASSNQDAHKEQVAELEETRDHLKHRLRKDRQTLKNAQETVEQLRIEKQDLEAKAQHLRQVEAKNEDLTEQIEDLRAKVEDLEADRAAARADEGPSEPDEAEVDAAYAEIQQKLGNAFRTWCQQGRVMVGRYYMFERAVQDAYPDATVSPIYHTPEADIPFQFEDRRAVATFWLVEIRGTSFLLPVPRRDGTFEALEPAVPAHDDGNPAELVHATPARVVATGMGYQVEEVGQFAFEASVSSSG